MSKRDRKLVVAGMIIDGDKVLISQRRADQSLPLGWEFPGGKMEEGESPEHALVRELREELGVEVAVERVWEVLFHAYPSFDLVMLVYPCRMLGAPRPRCIEVADFAWVLPRQMRDYDILEADSPLVERLIEEGLPPVHRD